jgi:DNA mismatch repair protein MutL
MPIRRLDPLLVDRIAAGEVVERPAAAVKELIENALDAGARRIDVAIEAGGRALIRVADDGAGMDADDLALSVERHATSKIPDGDLSNIATLGFRGEALPSIASVSRLEIRSRAQGADGAFALSVEDGAKSALRPISHPAGTRVEARDLFAATPARLKFLKSDRTEAQACADVVRRLALASPVRALRLRQRPRRIVRLAGLPGRRSGRARADAPGARRRVRRRRAAGRGARDGVRISGWVGLPTFNKPNALSQYFFVNRRAARDRLLSGALRAAALDFIPRDRHAVAVLFVDCAPSEVDVNVHPAKAEVRFRDSGLMRALLIGAVRQAFTAAGHRASAGGGVDTLAAMRAPGYRAPPPANWDWRASPAAPGAGANRFAEPAQAAFAEFAPAADARASAAPSAADIAAPLGAARAQVHDAFIVAQTLDGVVIVDQHAAHERIVYEKLKRQREQNGIARQILLSPLVVDLEPRAAAALADRAAELEALGLVVEPFGPGAALLREAPALLDGADMAALVRDLAEDLAAEDGAQTLERKLDHRLATIACHHSVRAGRQLKPDEMNALLREMEATPGAGQCNHGRPTYVELKLADIERLFGRR